MAKTIASKHDPHTTTLRAELARKIATHTVVEGDQATAVRGLRPHRMQLCRL